jgi:transcriptional regulator with XRE-family HTH domain
MGKELKDRLKEAMEAKKIGIQEVARQTKIGADRMYKWYKENTNPKHDDAKKLEEWLIGLEESPNEKPDTLHIALRGNQVLYDANRDLAYANRRLADAHYMLAESNRELVMALISSGKTFGIPQTFADPGMTPGDAEGSQRMTSGRKKKAG